MEKTLTCEVGFVWQLRSLFRFASIPRGWTFYYRNTSAGQLKRLGWHRLWLLTKANSGDAQGDWSHQTLPVTTSPIWFPAYRRFAPHLGNNGCPIAYLYIQPLLPLHALRMRVILPSICEWNKRKRRRFKIGLWLMLAFSSWVDIVQIGERLCAKLGKHADADRFVDTKQYFGETRLNIQVILSKREDFHSI